MSDELRGRQGFIERPLGPVTVPATGTSRESRGGILAICPMWTAELSQKFVDTVTARPARTTLQPSDAATALRERGKEYVLFWSHPSAQEN